MSLLVMADAAVLCAAIMSLVLSNLQALDFKNRASLGYLSILPY